jgi:hypothetical protein
VVQVVRSCRKARRNTTPRKIDVALALQRTLKCLVIGKIEDWNVKMKGVDCKSLCHRAGLKKMVI